MKPDPLVEIEVGVRGDTAASLGQAGRKLQSALTELAHAQNEQQRRESQLYRAAEALWALVVQREAIGITDHTKLRDVYGVTSDVWNLMGAQPYAPVDRPRSARPGADNGVG